MSFNDTSTWINSTMDASDNTISALDFNMTSTVQPMTPSTSASEITTSIKTGTITSSTTTMTMGLTTTATMMSTTTEAENTLFGLPMSNTILIMVFTGCTALILLVVLCICCRLLCMKSKRETKENERDHQQAVRTRSNKNHYADPYRVVENHYLSNDVTKVHYTPPEITYAKPEIYSTFINPSFYEDVYARWRLQEQAIHDKTYDSPWQYSRRLKEQGDTGGSLWSSQSLQALDNYDYDRFSRIPRGKVTSESERDETDTVAMEAQSFTTF